MADRTYFEQRNYDNTLKLRQLLKELPYICNDYFMGIENFIRCCNGITFDHFAIFTDKLDADRITRFIRIVQPVIGCPFRICTGHFHLPAVVGVVVGESGRGEKSFRPLFYPYLSLCVVTAIEREKNFDTFTFYESYVSIGWLLVVIDIDRPHFSATIFQL